MRRLVLHGLAFALMILAADVHGAFGFKFDGSLDKEAISKAYFEGEFERVLPPLEIFRQTAQSATLEDSIFVYKYLSVIYAADSSTIPKAESYMVQLLKLRPTIELIDLYISDRIEAIFRNVKEKFLKQQEYVRSHDIYGKTTARTSGPTNTWANSPSKRNGSRRWIWWSLAGVGAAATGAAIFILKAHDEDPYNIKP